MRCQIKPCVTGRSTTSGGRAGRSFTTWQFLTRTTRTSSLPSATPRRRRWRLYAAWQKWAREYSASRKEPQALTTKVEALKNLVAGQSQQLNTLKGQRDAAERAIRNTVEQQFADLEFVASPAAPFWQANDP